MDPIRVPDADDTRIPFEVNVSKRRVFKFSLPRFDFVPEVEVRQILSDLEGLDKEESLENDPLAQRRRVAMTLLKHVVTAQDLKVLESLPVGKLEYITSQWRELSGIPVGEFIACYTSWTNMGEPSSSTSSTEGGAGETLDDDSAGKSSAA